MSIVDLKLSEFFGLVCFDTFSTNSPINFVTLTSCNIS